MYSLHARNKALNLAFIADLAIQKASGKYRQVREEMVVLPVLGAKMLCTLFSFLKLSFSLTPKQLKPQFEKLLNSLKKIEKNPLETRAFMYLDIISWLESKIDNKPVQQVIREKYLKAVKETGA